MKEKMSASQEGSTPSGDELKKLRKREQRILERLQAARKAQAKALERFQRAEARLQKRSDRLQRIEGRLTLLRQQREQMSGQGTGQSEEVQPSPETQPVTNQEGVETGIAPDVVSETDTSGAEEPSTAAESTASREEAEQPVNETHAAEATGENVEQPVNEARAAAAATEENVRLAAERASEQAETPQQDESPVIPQEIADIEEEEELTAAVTAETIAHITAERAAKAEVIAEISSKQTLEARRYVQEAEQALADVRAAIRSGALRGEEAEEELWRAEQTVTRAQAFLADAEANEEQAVRAAMDAEAEAEVAEGMAFAGIDHVTLLATTGEAQNSSETPVSSTPRQEQASENNDDDVDITTKISVIRPQEQS